MPCSFLCSALTLVYLGTAAACFLPPGGPSLFRCGELVTHYSGAAKIKSGVANGVQHVCKQPQSFGVYIYYIYVYIIYICRVGQNPIYAVYTYAYICGVYTRVNMQCLHTRYLWSHAVYVYGSGQPICIPGCV